MVSKRFFGTSACGGATQHFPVFYQVILCLVMIITNQFVLVFTYIRYRLGNTCRPRRWYY